MMIKLINGILDKMANICKPQRKFITEALLVILGARGKMNFRNMSRYSSLSEKTFSRNYEKPFNFAEFNQHALALILKPNISLIAAFDPSFIQKSGKKTYGNDYFWNGSASKAEKGLELGLLAVVDVNQNTAYSLSACQTPPIAASRRNKDLPITEESRVDAYLSHIGENRKYLPSEVRHLAGDGFFSKEKFVTGVKNMGLDMVGKLRIDARLRHLHLGKKNILGRPKKYAEKFDVTDLNQLEFERDVQVDKDTTIKLYTAIVNSVSMKRDVRVVLILDVNNEGKAGRALLFSTDLNLSAFDIYRFYKARYQIEFVFRDAKQFAGLVDCQSRSKARLGNHFNASFAALNMAKIEDRLRRGIDAPQGVFSMASCKTRFCNDNLIDRIFSMLGFDLTSKKETPEFKELRNYGTISNFA
jgi:hypothetical protein